MASRNCLKGMGASGAAFPSSVTVRGSAVAGAPALLSLPVMIRSTLLPPLAFEARKRERVRCSSLVDWPVYPRLRDTMQTSTRSRNSGRRRAPQGIVVNGGYAFSRTNAGQGLNGRRCGLG